MSLEISPRTPVVTRTMDAALLPAVMRNLIAESHSFYVEPEPNGEWSIYFNREEAFILDRAIATAAACPDRTAELLEMVAAGNTEPDRLQEIAQEILHPTEPSNYE
jgi:hypothetical protein